MIAAPNPIIERLIDDEKCSEEEAALLRELGSGPLPINYLVAHAMLLEHRNVKPGHAGRDSR